MQDLGRNHTGDEELSREQWIGRFALRLAMLDDSSIRSSSYSRWAMTCGPPTGGRTRGHC